MVSSHFSGSHLREKGLMTDRCEMPRQRWVLNRLVLSKPCRPCLNAHGKTAYWLIAALLLLVVFFAGILWYQANGVPDKRTSSMITPDRKDVRSTSHRYKIERPAKLSADSVGPEAAPAPSPETAGPADRQAATPPPAAGQEAEQTVSPGEAISDRKAVDMDRDAGGAPALDEATLATVPDASEKEELVPLEEAKTPLSPTEERSPGHEASLSDKASGKRFFVLADVANVRDQPSVTSKVLFQVRSGCSVTVTDKKDGWYSVSMDDGRLGWVHHAVLSDSLVPRKDILPMVREIKAIRVAPPVNQTVRVLFELSAPYVLEIQTLDGKMPRIVCDFFDIKPAPDIGRRIAVNNGLIQTIRIGLHERPQEKVRVVLDLTPGRRYEAGKTGIEEEGIFTLEIKAVEGP